MASELWLVRAVEIGMSHVCTCDVLEEWSGYRALEEPLELLAGSRATQSAHCHSVLILRQLFYPLYGQSSVVEEQGAKEVGGV